MSSAAREAILQLRERTRHSRLSPPEADATEDVELIPPTERLYPDADRYSPRTTNEMFKKNVSHIYKSGLHIPGRMSTPSEANGPEIQARSVQEEAEPRENRRVDGGVAD
mmetsp:Transcript_4064/g.10090  ORF Transcript_4064/g.10090 Transcript_4064/m.10090 type:complete len:110 (-) Transcript_4064:234-563(-)|eukprot:CAMPEP_0174909062 /NCGR_PEP_ID=MMETSP0167-20121228/66938_1 /TAXON_ID=38298 /ORGANISM="Rhodella maculata, Strain CCMP736" /LENGTH=109 /DNA_ID=CAMNT_0016152943 /DNA_START=427 /DNA_END=756 /DNA_ORIENTATION=-